MLTNVGRIVISTLVAVVMFVGVSVTTAQAATGKGQTTRVVPNPFTKSN